MLSSLLTTLFLACVSASPLANQYIDSVLNTALRNEVRSLRLDPAGVPNFVVEFEDKVVIIGKVKGKAEFLYGTLTGLSQATRYSECQGPSYRFGEKIVNCTIGLNNLQVSYDGKLKYGKMPKVDIKGKANISHTLLYVEVAQNYPRPPVLKNFMVQQLGYMTVKFQGLGSSLNKFLKVLEDGFRTRVNNEILNYVNQKFRYAFGKAVSVVPLPN